MHPISDNRYFISKENEALTSIFFLPFARENLGFSDRMSRQIFGKDWKKKLSQALGSVGPPLVIIKTSFPSCALVLIKD